MVNDQKIDPGIHRILDHGLRRIHRRADARDAAGVFHLQAVERSRRIPHLAHSQQVVEISGGVVDVHSKKLTATRAGRRRFFPGP